MLRCFVCVNHLQYYSNTSLKICSAAQWPAAQRKLQASAKVSSVYIAASCIAFSSRRSNGKRTCPPSWQSCTHIVLTCIIMYIFMCV